MAVQSLALFGLGLIFAILAHSVDGHCNDEECASVAPDPAAGPSLLQAHNNRESDAVRSRRGNSTKKHSKRSSRREAGVEHDDGHGDWGGCADTNGVAVMNMDGDEWGCEGYSGDLVKYCEEDVDKDGDFNPKEMCCSCGGGGGDVPTPYGLGLENREEACEEKEVGDKCTILEHVEGTGDKIHLQSQCGADHDEEGHAVLACIPVFKLRELGPLEDMCKGILGQREKDGNGKVEEAVPPPDGTLCGRLFFPSIMYSSGGKGHKETYLLCSCKKGQCPHCRPGAVDKEHLPKLHEHEDDHEDDDEDDA